MGTLPTIRPPMQKSMATPLAALCNYNVLPPGTTDTCLSFSDEIIQPSAQSDLAERGAKKTLKCGTHIVRRGINYYIESPGYDNDKNYTNNYNCTYTLRPADANSGILLSPSGFDLQDSINCTADFLEISGVGRFCGPKFSKEYHITAAHQLVIKFQTNEEVTGRGYRFYLAHRPPGAGCGSLPCGTRYLERGTHAIFPRKNPDNKVYLMYCKWQLKAIEATDRLKVSCSGFKFLKESPILGCQWMWLLVNGTRYCGNNAPSVDALSELTVEFLASLINQEGYGFNCTIVVSEQS